MKANERMEKFLELQNKNINFEDISKEIGVSISTLRTFLNKRGYRSEKGKYVLKQEGNNKIKQIEFVEVDKPELDKKVNTKKTSTKKETIEKEVKTKSNSKSQTNKKDNIDKSIVEKKVNSSRLKPKKDRKINITQEDLDKLCEVYDWYLEVKDCKSIKPKKISSKKDINIEDRNLKDLKSTSIKVDKQIWEDFERLCSNSEFSKQEILTQALKDFMKEYKHLL